MGVQSFDEWAAESRLVREDALSAFGRIGDSGPVVGVDAAHFLERFRHPSKEPLVPALGGFPMGLEGAIEKQVKEIQSVGCKLWFYFDGLECAFETGSFSPSINAMRTVSEAFTIYETVGEAAKAIDRFRQSEFPDVASLIPFAKYALHKYGIPFVVAPFKAHAQMMHDLEHGTIDCVYGSSELFLYGADRVITKFSLVHQSNSREGDELNGNARKEMEFSLEKSTFSWIERDPCLRALGDISPEAFTDALLAAGSSYIGAFPPLLNTQPISFRHIVDLLVQCRHDIHSLCGLYQHDEHLAQSNWEDRFMRVHTAIQHMIVLYKRDMVKPRSYNNQRRFGQIPRDLHEIVGLGLPEELLFYMYNGVVGPRVMNWLISGKIRIHAPLAGGESNEYRKLVKEQLHPWRQQALALLAYSINRWFQTRDIETLYWFGEAPQKFHVKDLSSTQSTLASWRVTSEKLAERQKHLGDSSANHGPGSLHFAILALEDGDFASKTTSPKPSGYAPLKTANEIVANVLWRALYLREYINKEHQLTPWGVTMSKILSAIGPSSSREQIEAAFLSVELHRLGLLNADDMFSAYVGAPLRGNEEDKRNSILLSRLACTGKMRHPIKGYSGPLSRQLLAYHCLVAEVRNALRDLFEMALAVLFLEAGAERIRDDYTQLAQMLPFQENYSSGLGVIAKTYFDELAGLENPADEQSQRETMERAEGWFIHIDVSSSFRDACQLWKAIAAGISGADTVVPEPARNKWAAASKWLEVRT